MRWTVHGSRDAYASDWVRVSLADIEIPGGERFEHHVVHFPRASVTAVVTDGPRVLLLWRQRFITGTWGWEVPAGWAEAGEDLADTARREIEEETGYRPGPLRPMTAYNALSGISDMRFTAFIADGAERLGEPRDPGESSRVEWVPLAEVPALAAAGKIQDGPSLTALTYYLAVERVR
ncbi:MAG TPA: NUDIX hydrolase [Streptosporangiaceae bacterium]|nr:NUDIX hydrolase [Streptosporangiaceae bacterium]